MSERIETTLMAGFGQLRTGTVHGRLPLHVAIMPPFHVEQQSTALLSKQIGVALDRTMPFPIAGLEEASYDAERDIRVRKVGGSILYAVHDQILPIAAYFDPTLDQTQTGEQYTPHVTYIGPVGLAAGQKRTINCLTLAQQQYDKWHIVDNYQLKEPNTSSWIGG